jgi:uncharacterized membrane protein
MTTARLGEGRRRTYLDWIRGVAVLLMIEAHLLDSWTRVADRNTPTYGIAMIVGGMGSVLFLMLAGVAVALSAGSKFRRSGDARAAAHAVARRGLQIFALAFVFRLQEWFLGWSHSTRDLLKVDILNIMGPSIVAAALLWRTTTSAHGRCVIFALAAVATSFLTPIVRAMPLAALPDPLEAYINPIPGLSNFVFFPWMGLVFAGAFVGVLLDRATHLDTERRANLWLCLGGALLICVAGAASFLPSPYSNSDFWTTSPSYFFIRVGAVAVAIAAAYAWRMRVDRTGPSGPLAQMGRTSLFIYWIHVELVYGLISRRVHHALTLPQAWIAYVVVVVLMYACSIAKDRFVSRYGPRLPMLGEAASASGQSGEETLIDVRRITS